VEENNAGKRGEETGRVLQLDRVAKEGSAVMFEAGLKA
jgi:hypothetical protein